MGLMGFGKSSWCMTDFVLDHNLIFAKAKENSQKLLVYTSIVTTHRRDAVVVTIVRGEVCFTLRSGDFCAKEAFSRKAIGSVEDEAPINIAAIQCGQTRGNRVDRTYGAGKSVEIQTAFNAVS